MSPWLVVSFMAGWIVGPAVLKTVRALRESDIPVVIGCCFAEWYQRRHKAYHLPSVRTLKAGLGTMICIGTATVACLAGRNRYVNLYPLALAVVVLACTHYFGSAAGLFGAISAAGIFAWVLYPPASFAVDDPVARTTLSIMVLSGTVYSLLHNVREHRSAHLASTSRTVR